MRKHFQHLLLCIVFLLALTLFCACEGRSGASAGTGTQAETEAPAASVIYTIVRADNGTAEERDAAVLLRATLRDTYGLSIEIETDWVKRGEDVDEHRFPHEILVCTTNRAESVEAMSALHVGTPELVDYTITANENHYVIAAAPGHAEEAVLAFLSMYETDRTLLSVPPKAVDTLVKHEFPLSDILLGGISAADFDGVVLPDSYSGEAEAYLSGLSDQIYSACGVLLPVMREHEAAEGGRMIRFRAPTDGEVLSAGRYSWAVLPAEDGFFLEGGDEYVTACAYDAFRDALDDATGKGGVFAFDEPIRRLTETKEKLILSAWVISSDEMEREEQFAEIADCGFNQVILSRPSTDAALFNFCHYMAKYGLTALWSDGTVYENNEQVINDTGMEKPYVNSSVTWGHMLRDEPSAADFEPLAQLYKTYTEKTGNVGFINLFPDYANETQLGTKTYQQHLDAFFDTVKPSFASVDIYPLNLGVNNLYEGYFRNLDSFSTACRTRGIPFGVYIQSVSFSSLKRTPNEAEMRWQAYCCLSFGATDIEYFTYRTPNSSTEDFKDALIGRDNEKKDGWYGAQRVNAELAALSDAFLRYDNLGAYTCNAGTYPYMKFKNEYKEFDAIRTVDVSLSQPLLIGCFTEKDGGVGKAFTCVNANDPGRSGDGLTVRVTLDKNYAVTLYQGGGKTTLTPDENGVISFTLAFGEGVFVTLD